MMMKFVKFTMAAAVLASVSYAAFASVTPKGPVTGELVKESLAEKQKAAKVKFDAGYQFALTDTEALSAILNRAEPNHSGSVRTFLIKKGGMFSDFSTDLDYLEGYMSGLSDATGLKVMRNTWGVYPCGITGIFACEFQVLSKG